MVLECPEKWVVVFVSTLLQSLVKLIYPSPDSCPLCGSPSRHGFCKTCREKMTLLTGLHHCETCGRFFISRAPESVCHSCRTTRLPFWQNRAVGPHEGILKQMVHTLKYRQRLSLAEPMGRMMASVVRSDAMYGCAEVIVPVPLGADRLRERRFNQSLILAREIGVQLGLPVTDALTRKGRTESQTGLSGDQRRRNVRGVFAVTKVNLVRSHVVVLVDDVFTTGSTIAEASRALLEVGAIGVLGLTFTAARA